MIEKRHKFLIGIILAISSVVACSTAPAPTPEKDKTFSELQARLAESERLNKRLDRKIGRLEQVIAVTQDRIEAQNLASQYDLHQQHQPDPVPESRYSGGPTSSRRVKDPTGFRKERRISLGRRSPTSTPYGYYEEDSPNGDDVIVITQEDFDAFTQGSPKRQPPIQDRQPPRSTRTPQPDVTQERLRVTNHVESPPPTQKSTPAPPIDPNATLLEIYEEGLSFYRSGDFNNSLSRFQSFLAQKPDPSYMDNALYWIGESHFGLNNMKKSIHYFKRVLAETPTGNKVPNAMLKMAIAYRNIGQEKTSKSLLSKLVKKYPNTGAGQIAEKELEKLSP